MENAPQPQNITESSKMELNLPPKVKELFNSMTEQAVIYNAKIASAKTQLKKDYYSKKLQKLNKKIYALLAMSFREKK